MELPVYLFMGFLDAGKTTYVSNLMLKSKFTQGKRFLLIVCEEGEEEYDVEALRKKQIEVRTISSPKELTEKTLRRFERETGAQRIAIEYNSMWTLKP
ncbi:MAG: GTPase, partial [Clostridia bacterium]|nr:GTPase [Clostridia bacterium]